jgi:hypothetical protein
VGDGSGGLVRWRSHRRGNGAEGDGGGSGGGGLLEAVLGRLEFADGIGQAGEGDDEGCDRGSFAGGGPPDEAEGQGGEA